MLQFRCGNNNRTSAGQISWTDEWVKLSAETRAGLSRVQEEAAGEATDKHQSEETAEEDTEPEVKDGSELDIKLRETFDGQIEGKGEPIDPDFLREINSRQGSPPENPNFIKNLKADLDWAVKSELYKDEEELNLDNLVKANEKIDADIQKYKNDPDKGKGSHLTDGEKRIAKIFQDYIDDKKKLKQGHYHDLGANVFRYENNNLDRYYHLIFADSEISFIKWFEGQQSLGKLQIPLEDYFKNRGHPNSKLHQKKPVYPPFDLLHWVTAHHDMSPAQKEVRAAALTTFLESMTDWCDKGEANERIYGTEVLEAYNRHIKRVHEATMSVLSNNQRQRIENTKRKDQFALDQDRERTESIMKFLEKEFECACDGLDYDMRQMVIEKATLTQKDWLAKLRLLSMLFLTAFKICGQRTQMGAAITWNDFYMAQRKGEKLPEHEKTGMRVIDVRAPMKTGFRGQINIPSRLFKLLGVYVGLRDDYLKEYYGQHFGNCQSQLKWEYWPIFFNKILEERLDAPSYKRNVKTKNQRFLEAMAMKGIKLPQDYTVASQVLADKELMALLASKNILPPVVMWVVHSFDKQHYYTRLSSKIKARGFHYDPVRMHAARQAITSWYEANKIDPKFLCHGQQTVERHYLINRIQLNCDASVVRVARLIEKLFSFPLYICLFLLFIESHQQSIEITIWQLCFQKAFKHVVKNHSWYLEPVLVKQKGLHISLNLEIYY